MLFGSNPAIMIKSNNVTGSKFYNWKDNEDGVNIYNNYMQNDRRNMVITIHDIFHDLILFF